jgi:hypothetical protein
MRLHMCCLRLWEFITRELPYPSSPSAPTQPGILEKTTIAEELLLVDYDDRLTSYESQFCA